MNLLASAISPVESISDSGESVRSIRTHGSRTIGRLAARGNLVSVVIPHSGRERLPILRASLASLRQHPEAGEVIIVESGPEPVAEDIAGRWADRHVFIRSNGPFERARVLNVGSAFAEHDFVLWMDNDLLLPDHFLDYAVRDLRDRGLDFLVPYTRIQYLSEEDSGQVMSGTRRADEFSPIGILYSGRRGPQGTDGGVGLVRRSFLRRVGGFIEGFHGWGGEDNAWIWKAGRLGRTGSTARNDQIVHHLFHPNSGGQPSGRPAAANPYYAENVALMGRVFSISSGDQLLRDFPPPVFLPRPWRENAQLLFVADQEGSLGHTLSLNLAGSLEDDFGGLVEVVSADDIRLSGLLQTVDAIVTFGQPEALGVTDQLFWTEKLAARTVALPDEILTPDRLQGKQLTRLTLDVLEALSFIICDQAITPVQETMQGTSPRSLPVWAYWEGPCPEWIQVCHQTIAAHSPRFCLLTPETFDQLRDHDRDVDLSGLSIAHRADFIRAYLLAHYGGLWVDSDCVVMQSLEPLLELISREEFVAHRERSGLFSNGFIGASADSKIARRFYERVRDTVRAGKPRGWTSLGGEPLTELLEADPNQWHELRCEQVQPICWSQPQRFFALGADDHHAQELDRSALCYMMSNTEIQKNPGFRHSSLLNPTTFFSYLIRESAKAAAEKPSGERAGGEELPIDATSLIPNETKRSAAAFRSMGRVYQSYGDESVSGPGSSLESTGEIRMRLPLLLETLGVRSILDAPCGDYNWMQTVRLGIEEYFGVDVLPEVIARNQRHYGGNGRQFRCVDLRKDPLPRAELIFCRDLLVHLSFEECAQVLRNFRTTGAKYLVTTTFTNPRVNEDTSGGAWRTLNLELAPFHFPPPALKIMELCREGGGRYMDKALGVWELASVPAGM
ncbi:MAG: glycosyltransferase [Gemmatimonadota bacterium]|nr:glycosyltransferase [Gemmatimonadota bacterium]